MNFYCSLVLAWKNENVKLSGLIRLNAPLARYGTRQYGLVRWITVLVIRDLSKGRLKRKFIWCGSLTVLKCKYNNNNDDGGENHWPTHFNLGACFLLFHLSKWRFTSKHTFAMTWHHFESNLITMCVIKFKHRTTVPPPIVSC